MDELTARKIEVVDELPLKLADAVEHWLSVNQRQAVEVRHGVFPLGFVQRWIERAEEAEKERDELRAYWRDADV